MTQIVSASESERRLDKKHGEGFEKRLEEAGTLEVRDGDYILTYKHKRFRVNWKRKSNGDIVSHMVSEDVASDIHEMIDEKAGYMDFIINGKKETFSWIEWAGTSEMRPTSRFDPELPSEEEQNKNIKRLNLEKMKAIQRSNPEAWEQAKDSDSSFKSMSNILKTQKNDK